MKLSSSKFLLSYSFPYYLYPFINLTLYSFTYSTLKIFDKRLGGIEDYITDHYSQQNNNIQYTNPDNRNYKNDKEIALDDIDVSGRNLNQNENQRFNQLSKIQKGKEDTNFMMNSRNTEKAEGMFEERNEGNRYVDEGDKSNDDIMAMSKKFLNNMLYYEENKGNEGLQGSGKYSV